MDLFRQTATLTGKTLRIILTRHPVTTLYSALILPVLASVYLGVGSNLNQPDSDFGIGAPRDIRPLGEALSLANGGRSTVALINGGHAGGDIDGVIDALAATVQAAGKHAVRLPDERELARVCRSSLQGTSPCFGAVVFRSSPREGGGWNYTLRADPGLGNSFRAGRDDNDAEVYALPLQRAVDAAIAGAALPPRTRQYAYTARSEDERRAELRREYQSAFVNYLGVALIIALIGVCHHMPGLVATERESGMSQLIDAMMPATRAWHRRFARLASHHCAFTAAYLPGWIVASIICRITIWSKTSFGVVVVFFALGGFAITSMSLLAASFFRKAQLSGAVSVVVFIALGIVAQALPAPGTAVVAVLALLFTPCCFVFFITYMARYEQQGDATDLARAAPISPSRLPGIVLWLFLLVQIFAYPVVAAYVERTLHGVTRSASPAASRMGHAVQVDKVTKIYRPSWPRRILSVVLPPRPDVVAVDDLTLTVDKGEILVLLGANGSGKSTTLDIIAGISSATSGSVSVDASGGLGVAPQKNVLWDELTVEEHIDIFNRLKSPGKRQGNALGQETRALIEAIGLGQKAKAQVKTLSGGQKRKLQLGMMLTGGSAVCCIDEVSSGIDPLSRRKIWDILLSERGRRTIILTTHFLDEADLLADRIAILSRASLRAEGSSAQLKDAFGAGYRIHVLDAKQARHAPQIGGVECQRHSKAITYVAPSSRLAADVIHALEAERIPYKFSGPTIEDVFLNLAHEVKEDDQAPFSRPEKPHGPQDDVLTADMNRAGEGAQGLLPGRPVGWGKQITVFLRKRLIVFKTNWFPYLAAFLIPVVAAALAQILVRGEDAVGCTPTDQSRKVSNDDYTHLFESALVVSGPSSRFASSYVGDLFSPLVPSRSGGGAGDAALGNLTLKLVDSLGSFDSFIQANRTRVAPGGWWLGDAGSVPTLAYRADNFSMYTAVMAQSFLDTMLANKSISTTYTPFDYPLAPPTIKFLQVAIYFALACSIFPGLFGLYPNLERRSNIRGLQYSSGARAVSVWAAHLIFDFSIILVSMAVVAIIFATSSHVWYHPAFLFPVLMLYGLVSILVAYLFSLICGSSLATFAATSVLQGLGFAVYMIAFLFILTYSPAPETERNVLIGHWVISAIFPTGSLVRAFFVALNTYAISCDGDSLRGDPGAMTAYGGPILYLTVQAILLFLSIVWFESGGGKYATESADKSSEVDDVEIANELVRVGGPGKTSDGLQVLHLTKAFGKNTAVDNVTFGVQHGEVLALLGPNGAGKSTTISLIQGDIAPSRGGGDVVVEKASVTKSRAMARQNLGVCPQFDAIDSMTVVEHLQHFARIRGITDIDHQVCAVVNAVGLEAYTKVMANTLSGGNKRKLSLAMALTGNPSVILLDEPSSGLDAASKRIMWRTLGSIIPGRSILLTTHSMEEADALADRAGIMARRMLALGSTDSLRRRFGDTLHVHLVSKTAPHSTAEEMNRVRSWVVDTFPGAAVEQETFHGQMRFSIPSSAVLERQRSPSHPRGDADIGSAMGYLFVLFEENKDGLGIAHHSVSPTTLNQVFLSIVGQHDVAEEGYGQEQVNGKPWWKKMLWPV